MTLRLERLPDRPDIAAVLYGPIVLAGRLGGGEGLTEDKVYGKYGPEGDPVAVPRFDVKNDRLSRPGSSPSPGSPDLPDRERRQAQRRHSCPLLQAFRRALRDLLAGR